MGVLKKRYSNQLVAVNHITEKNQYYKISCDLLRKVFISWEVLGKSANFMQIQGEKIDWKVLFRKYKSCNDCKRYTSLIIMKTTLFY